MSSGLESLYPEGHWMCQLCVELVPVDSLHVDENGEKWDVCESCHQADKVNHDPLCPNLPCTCEPDAYGHMWTCQKLCQCDLIRKIRKDESKKVRHLRDRIERLIDKANKWRDEAAELRQLVKHEYKRGYKEAEKFYTNSCMFCGYAGEWSTYICDDCIEENKNVL
jgi:hypothetical protein